MSEARGWDVVVVGGIGTDYLARAGELPTPGRAVRGLQFLIAPGGKGLNAAVAAARVGARVALIGCVGRDPRGNGLLAALGVEAIDSRYVRQVAEVETAATVVPVAEDGSKQTLGVPGASACLSRADVRAAVSVLIRTRALIVQLEPPLEAVREAVELASSAGARVIVDPAPPAPLSGVPLGQVEILKPNADETEHLAGIRPKDRPSAARAAEALLARGARVVAIEAGGGTLMASAGEQYWLPRLPVRAVDTTGAGDAFAAGLTVALAEGSDWKAAGRFANAVAALATTRLGASPALPHRAEVLELLEPVAEPKPGTAYGAD